MPRISSSHCHKRGWIVKPPTQDRCYGQSPTCLSFVTNAIRIIFKTDTTVIWSICKDWESLFNLYFLYIPVQPAWLRHKVGKGLRLSIWERSDLYPKYWSWSPWSHHHCHLWQVVPSRRLQWSTFVSFSPSGMYLKLISGSGLSPAEVWRDLFRIQKLFLYSGLIVGIKKVPWFDD